MATFSSRKNIKIVEFSHDSIKNIKERIFNEKTRIDIEKIDASLEDLNKKSKNLLKIRKKKKKEVKVVRYSDKDFETGSKLPKIYHHLMHSDLYGVPIEEIDDFYKNDYVKFNEFFSYGFVKIFLNLNLYFVDLYCNQQEKTDF